MYITILAPPKSQTLKTLGNEMNNFGRGLPGLHYCEFCFSFRYAEVQKNS